MSDIYTSELNFLYLFNKLLLLPVYMIQFMLMISGINMWCTFILYRFLPPKSFALSSVWLSFLETFAPYNCPWSFPFKDFSVPGTKVALFLAWYHPSVFISVVFYKHYTSECYQKRHQNLYTFIGTSRL